MPKDHIIAQVVNDLRDTAVKFHDTQQLRERLRRCIEPLLADAPRVVADERAAFESDMRRIVFAAPAAQGDAKELADDEIDAIAMRECPEGLQTAGSLRRLVRAAIAAKAASK